MNMAKWFLCLVSVLVTVSVQAGTVISLVTGDGLTTVRSNGKQARVGMTGDEYAIVDYRDHVVRIISPAKKQVLVLGTDNGPAGAPVRTVSIGLKPLGDGDVIAGYRTRKFLLTANGKPCGVISASTQAWQETAIRELFTALQVMMKKQQAMLGGFAGLAGDCTLGKMQVGEKLARIGVPMRMEMNGVIESEVRSIQLDVSLPPDSFSIPAAYRSLTMDEMIRDASGQTGQTRPQIEQMLQQVEEPGQIDTESMSQMQIMQEMMRRQTR